LRKQGTNGATLAVPVRMEDRWECSDEESFHTGANRRDGCMLGVVFEIKKEILVYNPFLTPTPWKRSGAAQMDLGSSNAGRQERVYNAPHFRSQKGTCWGDSELKKGDSF
jgi:hypothetical protein